MKMVLTNTKQSGILIKILDFFTTKKSCFPPVPSTTLIVISLQRRYQNMTIIQIVNKPQCLFCNLTWSILTYS